LRRPELIAAGSGLLLIGTLFLPWYTRETDIAGSLVTRTWTAWQATPVIATLLFLVGAIAAATAVAPPGFRRDRVLLPLGLFALLLVVFRAIDLPLPDQDLVQGDTEDTTRKLGLYLALVASAAIAVEGWRAARAGPR
jgi:hypothetical protein